MLWYASNVSFKSTAVLLQLDVNNNNFMPSAWYFSNYFRRFILILRSRRSPDLNKATRKDVSIQKEIKNNLSVSRVFWSMIKFVSLILTESNQWPPVILFICLWCKYFTFYVESYLVFISVANVYNINILLITVL